jgi:hypothetical protein
MLGQDRTLSNVQKRLSTAMIVRMRAAKPIPTGIALDQRSLWKASQIAVAAPLTITIHQTLMYTTPAFLGIP